MAHLPGCDVNRETPGVGEPLRLRQVRFAAPQFGCALGHLHLELVSSFAKLFFRPCALLDESCALKCRGGLIRGKRQQQLVRRRRKVAAFGGGSDPPRLATEADWDGNAAAGLRLVADVGNELLTGKPSTRGEVAV